MGHWFLTGLWAAPGHPALKPRTGKPLCAQVACFQAPSAHGQHGRAQGASPAPVSPRASSLKKDLYAFSLELHETPAPGQDRAHCPRPPGHFPSHYTGREGLPSLCPMQHGGFWSAPGSGRGAGVAANPPSRQGAHKSKAWERKPIAPHADALPVQGGHRCMWPTFPKADSASIGCEQYPGGLEVTG